MSSRLPRTVLSTLCALLSVITRQCNASSQCNASLRHVDTLSSVVTSSEFALGDIDNDGAMDYIYITFVPGLCDNIWPCGNLQLKHGLNSDGAFAGQKNETFMLPENPWSHSPSPSGGYHSVYLRDVNNDSTLDLIAVFAFEENSNVYGFAGFAEGYGNLSFSEFSLVAQTAQKQSFSRLDDMILVRC